MASGVGPVRCTIVACKSVTIPFVKSVIITAGDKGIFEAVGFLRIIKGFAKHRLGACLQFATRTMTDSAVRPTVKRSVYEIEAVDEDFKPLTREQAQQLRKTSPPVSLWRVLAWQLAAGVLVALVAWLLTGRQSSGLSALYGSLAVVIPAALFARGLTGKIWSMNPVTAVAGFFLWEMVKLALTFAMLFAAPKLVSMLSWPIMLVGLVVTMKVSWLALYLAARHKKL